MIRVLIFLSVAILPFISLVAAGDTPPNVLLIVTDEHNFRTLGCYRDQMPREQAEMWGPGVVVPTPNLDRIADEGVICTRAYATSPVCSPCRAAMITGRYPHNTGVPKNDLVLDRSIPTLADRLNDEGYRTGFFGKWHLGGTGKPEWAPKVDGGFQFKKYMFNRGHWKKLVIENGNPIVGAQRKGQPSYDVDGADDTTFATDWLTDRAIDYVTDTSQKQPYFAVISYPDPHGPNSVRAPYDHRFDELRFSPPRTFQTGVPSPKWLGAKSKHERFRGDDMSKYFGMVQCIDDNIGKLLDRMEATDQLDNTLVIMTSDHGDLCYEHDRLNKGNPYEGSARVPLIVRFPDRIAAGQVYAQPVGTVDLTPTVIGLLGREGNSDDEGRDLSGDLTGTSERPVDAADPPITFLRSSGTKIGWVAAVDARFKLVLSVSEVPWLFDAKQDPDELLNFYRRPGTDGVAERLGKALEEYLNTTADPAWDDPKIKASLTLVLASKPAPASKNGAKQNAKPVPKPKKQSKTIEGHQSNWQGNRLWIGPDWWANPMTDWALRKGSAIAPAAKDRTLCLLTADLSGTGKSFETSVEIKALGKDTSKNEKAGFRLGRRGGIDDYRHALVHATQWIDAAIRRDGRLILGDSLSKDNLAFEQDSVVLRLEGTRDEDTIELTLSATSGSESIRASQSFPLTQVLGGFALLSDGPSSGSGDDATTQYTFRDFQLGGDLVTSHADRSYGPILWSQYTLNGSRLRLQAQFAPLGMKPDHKAELWTSDVTGDSQWAKIATQSLDKLSRTATFTVDDWQSKTDKLYQVRFDWRGKQYVWDGRVRREPEADEPLKLGCFSCDNGYLFPLPAMVGQVLQQDPDMVFFAGDQIYESYGGFGVKRSADSESAMIDYLRKYYQFGWTWRDVLRDRPSVILPDDHDVFQGNIWGHGGRKLPPSDQKNAWTLGGYLMPGDWVTAVEKTIVGHLPDPAVDMELPIGIKPYFTSLIYGGIGFAILEDRKFKTGPMSMPEAARKEGEGADLLGDAQEAFLRKWGADWSGQQMKCALSQTIFCTAATHTGHSLKRSPYFFDSGAWPIAARNRAVRILGDCNALAIHGDQHLGVLLRHGVDDFDDAGYAFMVPGTANGFPRAWWPGVGKGVPQPGQDYTGKFHDDAGHPIHVLAVGNPEPGSNLLPESEDPMVIGYRKGSGYGIVEFNKNDRTAKISMYRLGDKGEMFNGFPKTIAVGGKP